MGIVTDSTPLEEPKDADKCNVFKLYKLLGTEEQTAALRGQYEGGNFGYGHAKQSLYELILEKFAAQRERFNYLMENKEEIEKELKKGACKARVIAQPVLQRVRDKAGY